jgi:voltage-gated potassium channel
VDGARLRPSPDREAVSSPTHFERRPLLRRTLGAVPGVRWLVGAVVAVSLGCAIVARLLAPDDFSSFGDALWWAAQTVTTVGYGDITPKTNEGRAIAFVLMLAGFATLSLVTASISAAWVNRQRSLTEGSVLFETLERIERRLDEIERRLAGDRPR